MRQHAGRVRRGVATLGAALVLALTALTVLTGLAVPAAADDPPADEAADHPVAVRVLSVSPQVLRPGEDLTVRVEVRNTSEVAVALPTVALHLDTGSFISRSSLDRWRSADLDGRTGGVRAQDDSTVPLAAGEARSVTLVVPSGSTGLTTRWEAWGAHGIAATVVDRGDPARTRLGVARSFMLWYPLDDVTPTRVSVLVPVVGPAPDPLGDRAATELERLTAPDGRLTAVLAATAEHTDVTWLLDPSLVDGRADAAGEDGTGTEDGTGEGGTGTDGSATADEDGDGTGAGGTGDTGADGGSADGTEGEGTTGTADDGPQGSAQDEPDRPATSAQEWAADLLAATVGRDVPLLPYGDADVTALAHADEGDLLRLARQRSQQVAESTDLPDGAASSLALPAEALPDRTTAAFTQAGGEHAVVVAPGELLPPGALTYTPSGRTTVTTGSGDVTVLVPDERLSLALRTGGFSAGPDDVTPAAAAQDVLAELAVVTRERPSDSRHLLLTVPRTWSPDADVASAQLAALAEAPWVSLEPVSALVGAPDPGIDRGTLPESSPAADAVTGGQLDRLEETLATRAELAQIVQDPAALIGDPETELLAAISLAWRADPQARRAAIDASVAATESLRSAVQVRPGSQINLISSSGELPVVVENLLDQPVEVQVGLRPSDARLRVDRTPTVTLEAGAEQTVHIPVHAIQSGNVPITVELRTADGTVLDDSTVMQVNVRAEWETIGTAVLGALLALGVVVGVIRTIRRGRTGRRAEPIDAGPDALSPEEVEAAR